MCDTVKKEEAMAAFVISYTKQIIKIVNLNSNLLQSNGLIVSFFVPFLA